MPYFYDIQSATAGNHTCSATPGTEVGIYMVAAGSSRPVGLQGVYLVGKGAGLTAISGIACRVITLTTASTGGTAITPAPKRTGMPAAVSTSASAQTVGATGRVNHLVFGCGAAGPGGWVAPNEESRIAIDGGSGDSIDMVSASGTASLTFEASAEIAEF
jgi:hypothetical protein